MCISQLFYTSEKVTPYSIIAEKRYQDAENAMKSYQAMYATFQQLTTNQQHQPLTTTEIQSIHEQHQQSLSYENFPLRERSTLAALAITAHFTELYDKISSLNKKMSDLQEAKEL